MEEVGARAGQPEVTVAQEEATDQTIPNEKGKLGFLTILLITINSIMGTGIFFLPAVGAREGGLLSIFSWIVMGLVAIYFGMMFAELVGRFPKEGGVYEYAKEAFGHFPSFLLGWMSFIAANVTIAMLIVGAIKYIGPVLPNSYLIIASIIFIIMFNFMAFKGLKTGAVMLVAFALITLTAVFGIMIPGLIHFNIDNFSGFFSGSFAPADIATGGILGMGIAIFVVIFFIAETFFGWETATFLAEEVKNPRKVMPKVMKLATVLIAIFCLLFVIASFSLIPWQTFGQSITPLSDLAATVYGIQAVPIYGILVYLAIIGSVAGWIVATPNLILALAKDKLFLTQLAKKHPKTNTPYKAIIFQTILTSILVILGAGNYETLLHLLVPLVLILYSSVVLSLIFIRRKYPHTDTYKAPGGKLGPILLILFALALVVMWILHTPGAMHATLIIFSFIFFGIPIYLLLIFYYDPEATIRFQNKTSILSYLFERFFLPKRIQRKFLENTQIRGRKILELGASSGLISKAIAKQDPAEQIIIEQSEALTKFIKKRLKHAHNVRCIYDEHLTARVHPEIKEVNEIFSFGILTNLHNEEMYLKDLGELLPEHGRIHIFDYVDMYKFIPNKEILNDMNRLRELFRKAGFAIKIRKIKGALWNYLIIDGIKTKEDDVVFI
ncbi:amino acid permease [Candidatus Woesearchaeota archaeon]|nr:amino acid permease [Candidatus Woesearchaeota archaeon]